MVCKFAKNKTCDRYEKDGFTCNQDNGGPFKIKVYPYKIVAYCGKWNSLEHGEAAKKAVLLAAGFPFEVLRSSH